MVILASLPLCCGVLLEKGKTIGCCTFGGGILVSLLPYINALMTFGGYVSNMCSMCYPGYDECSARLTERYSADEEKFKSIAWVFAYVPKVPSEHCLEQSHGCSDTMNPGFFAALFSVVAASLAGCIFCNCCKMKHTQARVLPTVIGHVLHAPPEVKYVALLNDDVARG